jgi:SAM-dependent methyltransferase
MKRRVFALILIIPLVGHLVYESPQGHKSDVPYVPTPFEAVEEMLRLAEVGENDILYDLGCGDGRIVIMAAQKFNTRSIGIEIDPRRIQESRMNAAKAEVEHLVNFREENFFHADLTQADVLTLYLLTKVNLDLRAKLFQELRPGSRVVSHKFKMDQWLPDKSSAVYVNGIQHQIFLWIIPANVSGSWDLTLNAQPDAVRNRLELEQLFQFFRGVMILGQSQKPLQNTWLDGNRLGFTVTLDQDSTWQFEGKIEGNVMSGKAIHKDRAEETVASWKAYRKPFTMKPLDPIKPSTSSLFHPLN